VAGRFDDVENIHCFVARAAEQRAGTQYPGTVEAAKFSLGYLVPYVLIHGAPRIAAFTEKALQDGQIKAMQPKVAASLDPELGDGKNDSPVRIRITMKDGRTFEQRKDYGSGSNRHPMTKAQLEEKYLDCAVQSVDAESAKKILTVLNELPERQSLADLWPLLRKS
jgi:2-methylcitrate dehydratase PrpD